MSNLTNTVKKSSHNESQTDTLTERPSSLMCVSSSSPVQPSSIEELRMWLVEAFPASPSQSQDHEKPKMTPEICGLQQPTLFASSDLPAFSWKMCRDYLASTTQKAYSLTLPKWGMWDATGLYPLPMLVQGTGGKGSGLSRNWPSPTCSDVYTGNLKSTQQKPGSMHSVTLPQAVAMWPTPDANCGNRGTQPEWKPVRDSGHTASYTINQAVRDSWPTPNASDDRDRGNLSNPCVQRRAEIGKQLMLSQVVDPNSGALNPDWVSWLMGWPIGWADVKPLGELDWRDWSVDPADIGEVPRVTSVKENRANQLKALGNGQVPACVVKAWELLS